MKMNDRFDLSDTLVQGPQTVTTYKWETWLPVASGTAAVITQDGAYKQTLWPGHNWLPGGYWLVGYLPFSTLQVYRVSVKDRILEVEDDFLVQYPAVIPVHLSVALCYRVIQPEVVALAIEKPLSHLRHYVLEAMRYTVNYLEYKEFLTGGHAPGDIRRYLESQQLEHNLGIQILGVQIGKVNAEQEIQAQTIFRLLVEEAITKRNIAGKMPLTVEEIKRYNPELYEKTLDTLTRLIVGGINPAVLTATDPEMAKTYIELLGVDPGGGPARRVTDDHTSVQAECAALRGLGFDVSLRQGDDGNHYALVSGRPPHHPPLQIYLACAATYPQTAPQVGVHVAGEPRDFTSSVIQGWTPKYTLEDVIAEAVNFFGYLLERGATS
jgi:hypothetical protein